MDSFQLLGREGEGGVKMLVLCSDSGGEGWKPHCEGGAAAAEGITHRESRYKTELQEAPKIFSAHLESPKYFELFSTAQGITHLESRRGAQTILSKIL